MLKQNKTKQSLKLLQSLRMHLPCRNGKYDLHLTQSRHIDFLRGFPLWYLTLFLRMFFGYKWQYWALIKGVLYPFMKNVLLSVFHLNIFCKRSTKNEPFWIVLCKNQTVHLALLLKLNLYSLNYNYSVYKYEV